jgi:hypothetical protein
VSLQRKLRQSMERKRPDEDEEPASAVPVLSEENRGDAVGFAELFLKFKPFPYQAELLEDKSKRIIVMWPRRSGKSTTLVHAWSDTPFEPEIWRARRELNPGPPGLLRPGKSFTELVLRCSTFSGSTLGDLTELRAQLTKALDVKRVLHPRILRPHNP